MRRLKAPEEYSGKDACIFIAGGITGCPDWQNDLAGLLKNTNITILNPRRESYSDQDPDAAPKQIEWEHRHLKKAGAISFWFPKETLCPITLYELGAWSATKKKLFVGVHPEYARKLDVEVQTKLARPDISIVSSLRALAEQITDWTRKGQ